MLLMQLQGILWFSRTKLASNDNNVSITMRKLANIVICQSKSLFFFLVLNLLSYSGFKRKFNKALNFGLLLIALYPIYQSAIYAGYSSSKGHNSKAGAPRAEYFLELNPPLSCGMSLGKFLKVRPSLSSQISRSSMFFLGSFFFYYASSKKSEQLQGSLHLLPFLGDNSPVLPVVQYLKTVVSYILFNILIIYIRSIGLELVSLS